MISRAKRNLLPIILAVCLLTGFCTDLQASESKNTSVFILHSYSQEYPWTKRQHDGFIQRLSTATPGGSTICVEYLDTKRLPYTDIYAGLVADYLERRYASFHPDLIYVTDDNALIFALSHLSRIFPNSPIFFSGVNNYEIKPLLPRERVTGVFERKEVAPNLALLAHLTPPAKELVAVGDSSETYLAIQREIEIELQRHSGINVRFVANKQIEPMLDRLRGCSERYLFLTTMGGMKDSTGRVMSLQETIASVVGAGSFVVSSMEDAYLYPGVLGGWVTSGKKQGGSTADLVARYLSGTPIAEIAPIEQSPNEYVFEDIERERIGLKLPVEVANRATILNPLPTFYHRHINVIVTMFYMLIVLFVALLSSFLYSVRLKNRHIAKSEASLAETHRMAKLGHWELDLRTNRLVWSAEVFKIFEIQLSEFGATYETFLDLIHLEDRAVVNQAYTYAVKNRMPFDIVHRLFTKNGSVKFVHERGETIYDESGKPLRSIGTAQDITERRRVEEEYRSLSDLFRLSADTAQDMIWVKDVNGKYLFANKAICANLLGARDTDEPIGKTDMYFALREREMNPSDPNWHTFGELCLNSDEITLKADRPMRFNEFGNVRGTYLMLDVCKSPLKDKVGKTIGVVGTARDITEQKRAEENLQYRENLLKATLESTADGILVIDNNSRATHWNCRFQEMWQIPQDIIDSKDDNKLLNAVLEQLSNPEEFLSKVKALYKSSDESFDCLEFVDGRVFERYSCPLISDEAVVGRVWSFRDMTQRKKAEETRHQLQESLEKAQRMESLGILAGGVAHDLNNILGPIVGYSELLMREFPEESKASAKLGKINKSAHDAAVVVQDLLTLARRGRLEMKPTDLKSVIQGFINSPTFEDAQERNRNIIVQLNLSPSIDFIQGSEPHIEKAVMNLVFNAFEAMPTEGTLTISTEQLFLEKLLSGERNIKSGNYALLRVRDTGCGISQEDIERIFEPYFSKKKMGRSGSGLGLSVVYGVVKDHHGYYDIISEVNKGTEFILYFPVSLQEKPSSQPVRAEAKRGNETVLIVDDDDDQREMALEIVSSFGYTVHVAENGHCAVEFLSRNHADLILLDMIMEPDFDGLDTYREILKINPHQKAIVVSGYSATVRVQKVLELGASCYVKKPYGIETLAMAMRAALDNVASLTVS